MGPIAFEDFEALEAGQSHEFVSPALLTPSPVPTPRRPNWVPCRVSRPRKDRFELRAEDGAFMLGARVVGGVCYVSTAEAFVSSTRLPLPRPFADAQAAARAAPKNVVAVVAPREGRNKAPVFELVLVSAQRGRAARPLCEVRPRASGATARRRAPAPRHRAAESAPTAHYAHDGTASPSAPGVRLRPSSFSRARRSAREDDATPAQAAATRVALPRSCPSGTGSSAACRSTRPEARALVLENFLVYTAEALRDPKRRDDAEAAVFQLGKLAPKTFALDFRHPMSALQAFGVALAAFRVKHSRGVPRISRAEAEPYK